MRRVALLFVIFALAGCAAKNVFLLADGRNPGSDPVLNQQFRMDSTVCQGELQKANLSGSLRDWGALSRGMAVDQVGEGCMAEKGYVLVPENRVAASQQALAAIAAEKAQREAAAAAGAPPSPTTPRRTAAVNPPPAKPMSQSLQN
jgi:hypothetical protein